MSDNKQAKKQMICREMSEREATVNVKDSIALERRRREEPKMLR